MTLQTGANRVQTMGVNTLQVGTKVGGCVIGDRGVTFGSAAPVSSPVFRPTGKPMVTFWSLTPVGVGTRLTRLGDKYTVRACWKSDRVCDDPLDLVNFGNTLHGYKIEAVGE